MQASFLHTLTRTTGAIEEFVRQKRSEDEQLEFKAIPWQSGQNLEAAKDVASFANHLGGDIILGISDKGDRADGWNPIRDADLITTIRNIRDWLINHIRPYDFAGLIEIEPVASTKPDHSVITVSIPASANLIGVEYRESDKLTYQFPIRVGRRTRWLTLDEIIMRSSATTRAIYIKLKILVDSWGKHAQVPIRFTSPVVEINFGSGTWYLQGTEGVHAYYEDLTSDTLTIQMHCADNHHPISRGHKLAIPLEFVKAAWRDPRNNSHLPRLGIKLDAEIAWMEKAWLLVTERYPDNFHHKR
jgi:schlafen family protein